MSTVVVCPDVDSWMRERYHLASCFLKGTCWMYSLANGNLETAVKNVQQRSEANGILGKDFVVYICLHTTK